MFEIADQRKYCPYHVTGSGFLETSRTSTLVSVFCEIEGEGRFGRVLSEDDRRRGNMALNSRVTNLAKQCMVQCKRNYGVSAVLMQKSLDPIQQLFVDKIREYAQKSKSKSEMFLDADPSITEGVQ
ncbi:hypothetical protein MTO96_008542 [Rhipicephalus appendiculatus]